MKTYSIEVIKQVMRNLDIFHKIAGEDCELEIQHNKRLLNGILNDETNNQKVRVKSVIEGFK